MNSDSIILSLISVSHLFFICWAVLAFMNTSYFIYNVFFIVCLFWSVHDNRSSAPLFIALLINLMAIVMDAILMGILWPDYAKHYTFVLSALMTFLNLFYRFITSLIIFQIMRKRGQMETNSETIQSASKDFIQYLNFRPQMGSSTGVHTTTTVTTERSSSTVHLP